MNDNKPTIYINGVFIREHTFKDGGAILKVNIPVDAIDKLAEQLLANADGDWTRLKIQRLREPKLSKAGKELATHSLSVDDWKPDASRQSAMVNRTPPQAKPLTPEEIDSVPF